MYPTQLGYQLMESNSRTKGLDLGRKLEIANGAAARWVGEKEGRKKERDEEEREREGSPILSGSRIMVVDVTPSWVVPPYMAWLDRRSMEHGCQSRYSSRRLSRTRHLDATQVTSVARHAPAPCVTPVHMAQLLHEPHQLHWSDSKGPDLANKFQAGFISWIFLTKGQNTKKILGCRSPGLGVSITRVRRRLANGWQHRSS
jgi:hypothetical protein